MPRIVGARRSAAACARPACSRPRGCTRSSIMCSRLAEDHDNAQYLAAGLRELGSRGRAAADEHRLRGHPGRAGEFAQRSPGRPRRSRLDRTAHAPRDASGCAARQDRGRAAGISETIPAGPERRAPHSAEAAARAFEIRRRVHVEIRRVERHEHDIFRRQMPYRVACRPMSPAMPTALAYRCRGRMSGVAPRRRCARRPSGVRRPAALHCASG